MNVIVYRETHKTLWNSLQPILPIYKVTSLVPRLFHRKTGRVRVRWRSLGTRLQSYLNKLMWLYVVTKCDSIFCMCGMVRCTYIHCKTTNTDLGDSPLHIYNTLATTMLLGQTKVQVPCLPHQCYINTEMYCWATFCVGVFPPMGRVIWKARDTPGSWEVLHTSQASTSCLLSTSVYQVKVENSPNWPLQCKIHAIHVWYCTVWGEWK